MDPVTVAYLINISINIICGVVNFSPSLSLVLALNQIMLILRHVKISFRIDFDFLDMLALYGIQIRIGESDVDNGL